MQPSRRTVLGGAAATLALAWAAPRADATGLSPLASSPSCVLDPHADKTDLRGIWIASVTNIDWPSRPGLTPTAQQAELVGYYDLAVAQRYNTVVVQVRPTADAFWPSPLEPWSKYLTGTQGRNPGYDPLAFAVSPEEAGRIVWFDALVNNVDRSWRNPNLLMWQGDLWLIDHGATMIWHHNWPGAEASAGRSYDASDHALARFAPDLAGAAAELAPRVTEELLTEVTAEIPDAWLADEPGFDTPDDLRHAYARVLLARAADVHARVTGIEEGK